MGERYRTGVAMKQTNETMVGGKAVRTCEKVSRAGKKSKADRYSLACTISTPIALSVGFFLILTGDLVASICGYIIIIIPAVLAILSDRSKDITRQRYTYRRR